MADVATRRISDDGLWEWDGKKWVHVSDVTVRCDRCGSESRVKSDKGAGFKCANGHSQDFVICGTCSRVFQRPGEHRDFAARCPQCSVSTVWLKTASPWTWVADETARGVGLAGADADRRVLRSFTLAAAGGTRLPIGSVCDIDFTDAGIIIRSAGTTEDEIPYSAIHAIQVTGSTTHTSAGVIGGGFGLEGAAEGMMAASVLNALTTRNTIFTLLRIATISAEYVFVSHTFDNRALQMFLTPVQPRLRQAQAAASQPTIGSPKEGKAGGVADELRKLATLRDEGVLDDAEFRAAKARLLGDA